MSDNRPSSRVEWRRVLAEGLAIVVSILLAFSIDAWWRDYQDRAEEHELLSGLRDELVQNKLQLRSEIDTIRVGRDRLVTFAQTAPSDMERVYADSAYRTVIWPLRRSYTNEFSHGFLTATVNSGKLSLIRDASLRAALTETEALDRDVSELRTVLANLAEAGTLAISSHSDVLEALTADEVEGSLDASALSALRTDPAVLQIVGAKIAYWQNYELTLQGLELHLDSVIAMIGDPADHRR